MTRFDWICTYCNKAIMEAGGTEPSLGMGMGMGLGLRLQLRLRCGCG